MNAPTMADPVGLCPRCNVALSKLEQSGMVSLVCGVCHGVCLRGKDLRLQFGEVAKGVAEASSLYVPGSPHSCPNGCGAMRAREVAGPPPVHFEACPMCSSLWFDHGEIAAIAEIMKRRMRERPRAEARQFRSLSPMEAAKKELALLENRQATGDDHDAVRSNNAWWLFALLSGLPVEGHNPVFRFPLVTWSLMVACCAVYGVSQHYGWELTQAYAMVPANVIDGSGRRGLFTAMFLHAGVAHLLGNLYFLKVFGDNVEDRLGRATFLGFYLLAGIAAGVVYTLVDPASEIPAIGASGAIAGVLGGYLVLFPDARLSLVPGLLSLFRWIHLRALWYLPFWFGWQVLCSQLFPSRGVAWWAHLGGFLAGVVLAAIGKRVFSDARLGAIAQSKS